MKGDEDYFMRIQREASNLANVTFVAGVSQDRTAGLYAGGRAFVLVSQAEGFPNVLIEAFKAGTPVVSLSVNPDGLLQEVEHPGTPAAEVTSPCRHWLGDRVIGVCAGTRLDPMAREVERLFDDDDRWTCLSRNSGQFAREVFAVDRVVEKLSSMRSLSELVPGLGVDLTWAV